MTLNKFCPVAQGEYYNNKSVPKSQLFFLFFSKFFLLHVHLQHNGVHPHFQRKIYPISVLSYSYLSQLKTVSPSRHFYRLSPPKREWRLIWPGDPFPDYRLFLLQNASHQSDHKIGKHVMVIQPCQPDTSVDLVDHALSDRTAGKQGKDQASYPHKNQRLR